MRRMAAGFMILLTGLGLSLAEELPVPTLDNAFIISIEHSVTDSAEVAYIKNHFDFGLYAWLCFSKTAFALPLDWHASLGEADQGIKDFKDQVDQYIQSARQQDVRIHLVLVVGLVRYVYLYREAKQEDIRNTQWYNDNKLASDSQIADPELMDTYVFATLTETANG